MNLTVKKGVIPRDLGKLYTIYQYVETGGTHRTLNYTYIESQKHTASYIRNCIPYANSIIALGDKIRKAVCQIPGVDDVLIATSYLNSNNIPDTATWDYTYRTITDPLGGTYTGIASCKLMLNGSSILTVSPSTGGVSPELRLYESLVGSVCKMMVFNYCDYSGNFHFRAYWDANGDVEPYCTVDDARTRTQFVWQYEFVIAQHDDRQHPQICTGVRTELLTTPLRPGNVPSKNPVMACDTETIDVTTFELTVTTS